MGHIKKVKNFIKERNTGETFLLKNYAQIHLLCFIYNLY